MTWTVPLSPFLWAGRFPNLPVYSLTIYNSKSVKGFLSFLAHQSLHFLLLFLDIWLFYRKGTLNTPLQKISRIGRFIQRGNYHQSFKVNKGEGWVKQSLGVSHLPIIKKKNCHTSSTSETPMWAKILQNPARCLSQTLLHIWYFQLLRN